MLSAANRRDIPSVSNTGDVNGDGFDDIMIGTYIGGGAGRAYIVFGGPSLPTSVDLGSMGAAGFVIEGIDSGDAFGWSTSSAGDVNGVGYDDIAIAAGGGDGPNNTQSDRGEGYIVFGRPSFPAVLSLQSLGSGGMTVYGVDVQDHAGRWSNGGDVNGDGFNDLVFAAESARGIGNSGEEANSEWYLIYGSASLPIAMDLSIPGTAGVTIYPIDDGDGGTDVALSDVNGDGLADVVIGIHGGDGQSNSTSNAGEVAIIYGRSTLPATIDMATQRPDVVIVGVDADDRTGRSVSAAGDVNGDGFADILIGADQADGLGNSRSDAGTSYLIFGGASIPGAVYLNNPGTAGIVIHGADIGDRSGATVSIAGDLNGDGFADRRSAG